MKDIASGGAPPDEAIYEEFDKYDVNKDGTVDREEFKFLVINIFEDLIFRKRIEL